MPSPDVDHEQAARLAAHYLRPELVARTRELGERVDQMHQAALELAASLRPVLDELIDVEDEVGLHDRRRTRDVDIEMARFAASQRARELFRSWSGSDALWARLHRLTNVLNDVAGIDLTDPGRIEQMLTEERGR